MQQIVENALIELNDLFEGQELPVIFEELEHVVDQ